MPYMLSMTRAAPWYDNVNPSCVQSHKVGICACAKQSRDQIGLPKFASGHSVGSGSLIVVSYLTKIVALAIYD